MTIFRYVWVSAAVLLATLEIFLIGVRNALVPGTGSPAALDVILPVTFGVMMLIGLWVRRRNRVAGSVLVAVGALPAAALWWTVILPLLVVVVLAGLIIDRRSPTYPELA